MKSGGHIGLGTNGSIVFLIAYKISFLKMYSFHTFERNLTEIVTKTSVMAAMTE